jgi:hypothetical protein
VVAVVLLIVGATALGIALVVLQPLVLVSYLAFGAVWGGVWRVAPWLVSRLHARERGISALDDEYGQALAILAGGIGLGVVILFNWFYIGPNPYPTMSPLDITNASSSTIASFVVLGALAGGLVRLSRVVAIRRGPPDGG